ncbi:MAG: hypothetical protein LBC59_01945 [Chitinispirillales bacterium]|nr:hypothetical protein [Chitinispirillales bacterium]
MESSIKDYFTDEQNQAIAFFRKHLEEWRNNHLYKYKYAIIRNNALDGIFDTFDAAYIEATCKYPQGSYIIQQIISDKDFVSFLSPAKM